MNTIKIKNVFMLAVALLGISNTAYSSDSAESCTIPGSNNPAIIIQEFIDFECKYCANTVKTMDELLKNYPPNKIRLILRNLPLSIHKNAYVAAKAFSAVCIQNPHLAFSYQKEIFKNQDQFIIQGEPLLYEIAEKMGVDIIRMKSDMNREEVKKLIDNDQKLAKENHIEGTPSFLIGNRPIFGAYEYSVIKKAIDNQLDR